jgi:hypothetical protein
MIKYSKKGPAINWDNVRILIGKFERACNGSMMSECVLAFGQYVISQTRQHVEEELHGNAK